MNGQNGQIKIEPKIAIEQCPDSDERVYHIKVEISKCESRYFSRPFKDPHKYLKDIGEVGSQLLKNVFAIPGVVSVKIEAYKIWVDKSPIFCWQEIEPVIIEALKKVVEEEIVVAKIVRYWCFIGKD